MKDLLKRYIPRAIFYKLLKVKFLIELIINFSYDFFYYAKYSSTFGLKNKQKLEAIIIKDYHAIEKGLTMHEPRFGFGYQKVMLICNNCIFFKKKYSITNQVIEAVKVIMEYDNYHAINNYKLDIALQSKITELELLFKDLTQSKQISANNVEYFKNRNASFDLFSKSRRSARNYSQEEISIEVLHNAFEIAKDTPSSCNRQPYRGYILKDKKKIKQVLDIQGGNRGFGHLTDTLIIIVSDLQAYQNIGICERHLAYVDGGMFLMNLLYSLHFNKIGTCVLNASFNHKKDMQLKKICNIPKSMVFIGLISCGYLPKEFKLTSSPKREASEIYEYI